jgi:hypothetical protein
MRSSLVEEIPVIEYRTVPDEFEVVHTSTVRMHDETTLRFYPGGDDYFSKK